MHSTIGTQSNPGYNFAVDFFTGREEQFAAILARCDMAPSDRMRILEIGSFEGRSACWFSDHWLDHRESRLFCVDTFKGGDEHRPLLSLTSLDLFGKFQANIAYSKHPDKVFVFPGSSAMELPRLRTNNVEKFNLIYIDGSHHSEDVLCDGINAWHLLRDGGALVFDDYAVECCGDRVDVDSFPIQRAADLLQVFFRLESIHDGTMRGLRKVAGAFPPSDIPMGYAMRAHALHAEQRDKEAMACLDHALSLEPTFTGALFQKGIILLSHGDYEKGCPLFELRHQRNDAPLAGVRYQDKLKWDGGPTDKRLILWAEEGLGDTVQMLRYVRPTLEKCPNMVLEVQPSLVSLCRQNFDCEVVPFGLEQIFDIQCSLLSPPGGFAPIPRAPYLRAPACAGTEHRIGLCWQGNPTHTRDKVRSIPFPLLEQLGAEFDFLSLQQEDLHAGDVAATAAVIAQLDLVITVDTMVAHLAGALGVDVWVLLGVDCDWRWGQKTALTPWYPSARLFRQQTGRTRDILDRINVGTNHATAGAWVPVLGDVAAALRRRTKRSCLLNGGNSHDHAQSVGSNA